MVQQTVLTIRCSRTHLCANLSLMHVCQVSRFERQLRSALQSTEHLGTPNAFRTAVCFKVLATVSDKFERFRKLIGIVRDEMEHAVYAPSDSADALRPTSLQLKHPVRSSATVTDSFARKTYYAELNEVLAEKQSLERDLYVLS